LKNSIRSEQIVCLISSLPRIFISCFDQLKIKKNVEKGDMRIQIILPFEGLIWLVIVDLYAKYLQNASILVGFY
jgi:hypothetical protein